jgi:glycerol kinase
MLMNTGSHPISSKHKLLTTIAWKIGGEVTYALEGSVFVAGAAIQWLRDGIGIIKTAAETEELAVSVPSSGGVYMVPALTGLGAPYWDMNARGTITGLTRGTTRAHLVRAALEALAFQVNDVLEAMNADRGVDVLNLMRADGGASANNFLMQFQSDVLDVPVERPAIVETTCMGAIYLAGLAVGIWNYTDIHKLRAIDRTFFPQMNEEDRKRHLSGWRDAMRRTLTDMKI